jgi:tetratricopeptide (TPR) repeat protein
MSSYVKIELRSPPSHLSTHFLIVVVCSVARGCLQFLVLGTDWGNVHVLDSISGNKCKTFQSHEGRVNDISIDKFGDTVASCSDDGKVLIRSLYNDTEQVLSFDRPIKAVAIDPEFSKSKKRQFVIGGMAGELILSEKGWFGNLSRKVLHAGEGPIQTIKWRSMFIAWANDLGVKLFDTSTQQRISYIDRPKGSPRPDLYRCRLTWKDDNTLLIGWGDSIKVAVIKENKSARGQAGAQQPSRYCELIALFETDYFVCGLAPFGSDLVSVAFVEDEEEDDPNDPSKAKKIMVAQRPELRIASMRNAEVCSDALSIRGFEAYRANDYHLEYLSTENHFYIVSPKDIVVAKPCDLDDHITWLHSRGRFEEAMQAAEGKEYELRSHDMLSIRQKYLADLVESGDFQNAASNCPSILGTDVTLWEKWICTFARIKQLKAISRFIPVDNPRLGRNVYDMVLNEFLQDDYVGFQSIVREWPPALYDVQKVIPALLDQLEKDPSGHDLLMETLGELYANDGQFDKALHIYLKLKRGDVFGLITKHNLFDSIQDKILLLMQFDPAGAAKLLVGNIDKISVPDVIAQLREYPEAQFTYLEKLSEVDPHAGKDFGTLQVQLTAEYHPKRLMNFLRSSNYVPLKEAMAICEERRLIPEQVFLLQRMGMTKKALELIVTKLGASADDNGVALGEKVAVERAIEFCKEVNDNELWDDLIQHSLEKPDFILGLLNGTGTYINPMRLIKRIHPQMEIPGLRSALVQILHDFNLQSELRLGCKTILENDSIKLFGTLVKKQKRGMRINPAGQRCPLSNEVLSEVKGKEKLFHFSCGQIYTGAAMHEYRRSEGGNSMLCPCALPCGCRPPDWDKKKGRGGRDAR